MVSRRSLGPKPMTIREISELSKRYEYNPRIQLKVWLRTADILLREASIYRDDGNYEQSYMLLMRYVDLIIEKLRGHPDAKLPKYKGPLRAAMKAVPSVVEQLEAMKPRILRNEQAYEARVAEEKEAAAAFGGDGFTGRRQGPSDLSESDPAVAGRTRTISANDHGDIPVKLYKRESRRRDDAKRSGRVTRVYSESDRSDDDREMRRAMEDTRRRLNKSQEISPQRPRKLTKSRSPARSFNIRPPPNDYAYPSIKKSQPFAYDERPLNRDKSYGAAPSVLPPVPGKEALINQMSYDSQLRPPSRPDKILRAESPAPRPSSSPIDDADEYTFKPSAYLENGNPLRCLFLPSDLRSTFLSIAQKNTRNNLETCGMLCGTIMSNALFISRLVIPEQEGSSDTCEMTNENALFEFCDSENLIVLGWIHTHPTQSCFMSSRDLHTHCGFQVMMPEAIAIVCAPSRQPDYGVFRLTDPPGMQNVLNCSNPGLFHPHPENDTYTDALKPGHVYETHGLEFQTVDLRPLNQQ